MSLPGAHSLDSALLVRYVLEPAVRSLALAGLVWLLLGAFRVRDVSFRLAAWTAVLYAALAMPLLGRLLPRLPVLIPVGQAAQTVTINPPAAIPATPATMLATSDRAAVSPVVFPAVASGTAGFRLAEETRSVAPAAPSTSQPARTIPWLALGAGAYCLIAGIFLGRFAFGFALSRRLRRSSRPIQDARLERMLAHEAGKARLKKVPQIAQSPALSVPATLGVLRAVVLFPEKWNEWSETQLSAVLAHELSHIARRDALTQILSGFHRAFFWFSPLSWWLDRALVDLAEQASDDAALRAGADRTRYAEVLLHFFRALKSARGRVRWQAVSMAQGARSTRRLERVLSGARVSRRLGQTALAAVALAVVPLVCLAAAVRPSLTVEGQIPEPPTFAPPVPPALATIPVVITRSESAPVAPTEPATPRPGTARPQAPAADAPAPAQVHSPAPVLMFAPELPGPVVAMAPAGPPGLAWFFARQEKAAAPDAPVQFETESWFSSANCSGEEAFAIVSGSRILMECGSFAEMTRVRELRGSIPSDFLWFRKNGRSYVIRDPATVKEALAAFAPQEAFARQQAELESSQAEFGLRQAQVRIHVPDLSAEMRQLEAAMRQFNSSAAQAQMERAQERAEAAVKALDSSATLEQLRQAQAQLAAAMQAFNSSEAQQVLRRAQEEAQQELAAMQSRLGSLQAMAREQQAASDRQRAALGEQQAALSRQLTKLSRQQAELARQAAQRVRRLIDQAIARGLAKPE